MIIDYKDIIHSHYIENEFNDIDDFFDKIVRPSGYPFFEWRGQFYQIDGFRYSEINNNTVQIKI